MATATPAEVLQYLSGFTQQGLQTPGGSALCAVVLTRLRNLLPLAHRSSTKVCSTSGILRAICHNMAIYTSSQGHCDML